MVQVQKVLYSAQCEQLRDFYFLTSFSGFFSELPQRLHTVVVPSLVVTEPFGFFLYRANALHIFEPLAPAEVFRDKRVRCTHCGDTAVEQLREESFNQKIGTLWGVKASTRGDRAVSRFVLMVS